MGRYTLTTHGGAVVDQWTHEALLEVERRLSYELTVSQGSYNAGRVSASAGTHDRGGVVDLVGWHAEEKMRALRQVGFAAWVRRPEQGPWPLHVHAVLIGHGRLAPAARRQVDAYLAGRNGLANNGPDDGPRKWVDRRYRWRRGVRRIGRARAAIGRALRELRRYDPATGRWGVRGLAVGKARRALREARRQMPRP